MSSFSLVYVCSKQKVCLEMDEPIPDLPEKEQGELLTIYGDPDVEESFLKEVCIYICFIFCVMLRI